MPSISAVRRGYRASVAAVGPGVARAIVGSVIAAMVALAASIAWLVGVHRIDNFYDAAHVQHAILAVKQQAGRRMQARTIEIKPDGMTIWATDPDMPPERYQPGNRQHFGHYYYAWGVYEQSWSVTRWSFFGRDWYRVSGPEPAGIIEEKRGPGFDLRAEDVPDLSAMISAALIRAAFGEGATVEGLSLDARGWQVVIYSADLKHFAIERFDRPNQPHGETKQ